MLFRNPIPVLLRLSAVVVLLLGSSACVTASKNPFEEANPATNTISVFVENRAFNDFRVYAVTAGGTESLGSVGGNSQRRISLPWRQMDQISFRIEILAGRTYNTNGVSVSPGDRVSLIVPDDPANAYVTVR